MSQVQFVAEVSSNHNQDLDRCLAFIHAAADCGCSAVKFQLFRLRELFAPEILAQSERHRRREAWELPVSFLPELAKTCKERSLAFACTPFYLEAVAQLEPDVDFYKIASYELLWDSLLKACAATGKPVVLSTGMATLAEVEHAVSILRQNGCQELTLLHCVSGYPAQPEDCNLAVIDTLRQTCRAPVGWSDHTVNPGVVLSAAQRWGASMVEFHLDLDGQGEEFAAGHCWLPADIAKVIQWCRDSEKAQGNGQKNPAPSELVERDWRADPNDGLRPLRHLR